jgi:cytochrome P450
MGSHPQIRLYKAEYVEKLISTSKHIEKGLIYKFVMPWLGEGLLTAKDARWHKHRKIITPAFHFKILEQFCDVFDDKVAIMINRFENQLAKNPDEPIDIFPFVTKMALDIICETAMKTNVQAQNDEENSYVKAIYKMGELVTTRVLKPWLISDFIFGLSALKKQSDEVLSVLHGFTESVIKERKKTRTSEKGTSSENEFGQKKRTAFLDILLESNEQNKLMTDEDIRMEVDTFMFEGHDTTTANICWSLWLIGLDEKVQANIVEELDTIFQGSDRKAEYNDLLEMKYLDRVLKESLRLFPSAPFIGRVLSEDVSFDQYRIPKGTAVGIHIYNLHRDERFFPDAEKFDPDRFLPENKKNWHPYAYIPFSAGPRNCVGQKFAVLEEKSVISAILRRFKIKSANSRDEVTIQHEIISRPKGGLKMYFEDRKK